MFFHKEIHKNLRGGKGTVITYTGAVRRFIVCGRSVGKFIILRLSPGATIGMHEHTDDSEIYMTLNRKIRFCGNKYWRFSNHCHKGQSHSAANEGNKYARIFAVKY